MKKGIVLFLCVILVLLAVVGCKSSKGDGKINLKVYNYRDLSAPDAGNWDIEVEKFLELNPNITLEVDDAFNDPYHQKLQALAVSGDLPDIIYLWPGKKTGYVTDIGVIKDLRPFLQGHEDEFASIAMMPQGKNGEIYELPINIGITHIMYTNDALMEELGLTFPKTFDELIAQGDKIREAGYVPIAMSNKDAWEMQSCLLSTLVERAGGLDWWEKVRTGKGGSFADPEFVHALNIIKKLTDEEMFSPGINQAEYEQSFNAFVNGEAVYYIDGGWKTKELTIAMSEDQKQNVSFHAFPDIPDQKGQSGSIAAVPGAGFGMNAKLKGAKADAAWKWIWFYSGPEGSKLHQKFGILSAYKLPAVEGLDVIIKNYNDFVSKSPTGIVIDNFMDGEGVDEILNIGIQMVMNGSRTAQELGDEYEAWVAQNDSNRRD